ncbi:hypothetical protein [Stenotrophomonas maltophilia group sp. Smal35]|uniref:hypothetical protein n=1 Tax=Stenotrophomonas maltophilia group sp. Smal35 TaxID=3377163 RepID=UPI002554FD1E|nr:hypothetical protein [Stenotrophomonas maltophilia]
MRALELLYDIVGVNSAGVECHPFKGLVGAKVGKFSYTMNRDNTTFKGIDESVLRRMVESGDFNERGRIRMVSSGSTGTSGASALRVVSYRGRLLPL